MRAHPKFLTALLFGRLFGADIHQTLTFRGDDITSLAFQIIENIGLIMFIGSVGMIAGPHIGTRYCYAE